MPGRDDKSAGRPARSGRRIQLLGEPGVIGTGGQWLALGAHDAVLLAVLALEGPTPRKRLATLLWPDSEPRLAAISLRQRLFRLRRRHGVALLADSQVVSLDPGFEHDLSDLEAALERDPDHGREPLLGYGGFEDIGDAAEWVARARERWQRQRLELLGARAEALAGAGERSRALAFAERLVDAAPTRESGHRLLMRLHYEAGDRAAAQAAFLRCTDVLRHELGTAPGLETRELAAWIGRADEAAERRPRPALPPALQRPPSLIGREREWQALDDALAAERPLIVLTGGEGSGRSRLLAEWAAALGDGAQSHGPRRGDAMRPGHLLARVLAALPALAWRGLPARSVERLKAIAATGDDDPAPAVAMDLSSPVLIDALRAALGSARGAGRRAITLDDAALADPVSLRTLLDAVGAADAPTLVLTLDRDDESGLARMLEPLRPLQVDLLPWDLRTIERWVASLGIADLDARAWALALASHVEGQPGPMLHVLRAAAVAGLAARPPAQLPVPLYLDAGWQARLQRLSPAARKLAQLAALSEQALDVPLAAEVLGVHALDLAAPWRELQRTGWLYEGRLAHACAQRAVTTAVPAPVARETHRQLAQALMRGGGPAQRVAMQAARGGLWTQAAEQAEAAAQEVGAQSLGDAGARADETLRWLDRATAAWLRAGERARAFDAAARAAALALPRRPAAAMRRRLRRLRRWADGEVQAADAELFAAELSLHESDGATAIEAAQRALGDPDLPLPPASEPLHARRLRARCMLAAALARSGRGDEGLPLLHGVAREVWEQAPAPIQRLYWSLTGYALAHVDRRREAIAALEHAVAIEEAAEESADAMTDLGNLAVMLGQLGHVEPALNRARRADAWRVRLHADDSLAAAVCRMNIGLLCVRAGRYDEALHTLEQSLAVFRSGDAAFWVSAAENNLALLWLELGQFARARQVMSPLPASIGRQGRVRRAVLECRLDRLAGRPVVDRLRREQADAAQDPALNRLMLELAIAEASEPQAAREMAARIHREAERHELDALALRALVLGAQVHAEAGQHATAARLARLASAPFEAGCRPMDLSDAGFWWVVSQALAPDVAAAAEAMRRGRDWLVRTRATHVPMPFRETFVQRVPAHRALWLSEAAPAAQPAEGQREAS